MTGQTYEDGDTVSYTYDNSGALATVTDSATGITATYYYDLTDRLMKYVEKGSGYNHSVAYEYDTLNNLTQLVENTNGTAHTTAYAYDDDNRVTSVTEGEAGRYYTYDAFGRGSQQVTKHNGSNVLTQSATFQNPTAGKTTAQVATYTLDAAGYDIAYTYTYDDNGNITGISDGTNATSYVYDSANQLIRENNQAGGFTYVWEYDNAGNILSRTEYAYTTGNLEGVTPTDTVTYTYGDSNWGDLLTAYDGNTITYDQIGNPLTDGTWTYTWEHGRQLASMTDGTTTWSHTYNVDGLRTQRTNGTTTYSYVYNGGSLRQLTRGSDSLYIAYDASGAPMSLSYNGTPYYYATNLQGDITAILDTAGTAVVSYTYDTWGNILATEGTMKDTLGTLNPLRYRGYVYDQETGLYYLQSRYYNPEIGRFVNADGFVATGQSFIGNNMFAYCGNNPVKWVDPTGMRHDMHGGGGGAASPSNTLSKIKNLINNTVGAGITLSESYAPIQATTVIFGYEDGLSMSEVLAGDISKPVSFYLQGASDSLRVNEYAVGVQINTNNGGFRYSYNPLESVFSASNGNDSLSLIVGLNKIGFTISYDVNFGKYSAEKYSHVYIRTIPTAMAVATVVYIGGLAISTASAVVVAV